MQLLINISYSGFTYFLLGISFSIIFQGTRFFHIAHAGVIVLAGYFVYTLNQVLNVPITIAICFSVLFSATLGIAINQFIYNQFKKYTASSLILMIASLGIYIVLQNLISITWGDSFKIISPNEIKEGYEFFNSYITYNQVILIFFGFIVYIISKLYFKYFKSSLIVKAFWENPSLANIFGINTSQIVRISYGVGSGLGALVGILLGFDVSINPTMGFNLLFYSIVAMILGGIGSFEGLLAGSFLLALSQHTALLYVDSKWMDSIAYIVLILFLIWKPFGFSGKRIKKVEI